MKICYWHCLHRRSHLLKFFFHAGVEGVAFPKPWTSACHTGSGLAWAVHCQPITEPVSTGKPCSLHNSWGLVIEFYYFLSVVTIQKYSNVRTDLINLSPSVSHSSLPQPPLGSCRSSPLWRLLRTWCRWRLEWSSFQTSGWIFLLNRYALVTIDLNN